MDWKVPSILSIIISMLVIGILIGVATIVISSEIKTLIADISLQSGKINGKFMALQNAVSSRFNLDANTIAGYLAEAKNKLMVFGENIASGAVTATTSFMGSVVLIIIFVFCFLLYNTSFRDFGFALMGTEKHEEATSLINHIQKLVQNYLLGLITVTFIIGTLNSIGLLIIGVDHAIFFAFFAGLLTIIPYIGITIGAGLTFIYLLLTKDSALPAFGALAIMLTVQVLESNLITPRIVGKKVSINPFVAITVLLIGSALWGIPGMALSIPLTAIFKLLFDARPNTKAFGYFLGSEFTDDKTSPFKLFGVKEPKLPKAHKK